MIIIKLPLTLIALMVAQICSAQSTDEKIGLYAGLKLGYTQYSNFEYGKEYGYKWSYPIEDDIGYGLMIGYQLSDILAVEFESMINDSETKNKEINDCNPFTWHCTVEKAEIKSNSYAIYGVYRSRGDLYFKGRLGYMYQEQKLTSPIYNNNFVNYYESGVSISVGGGYKFDRIDVDVEYTYIGESLGYLSAGVNYYFNK